MELRHLEHLAPVQSIVAGGQLNVVVLQLHNVQFGIELEELLVADALQEVHRSEPVVSLHRSGKTALGRRPCPRLLLRVHENHPHRVILEQQDQIWLFIYCICR